MKLNIRQLLIVVAGGALAAATDAGPAVSPAEG